jgi:hypothetical protein
MGVSQIYAANKQHANRCMSQAVCASSTAVSSLVLLTILHAAAAADHWVHDA